MSNRSACFPWRRTAIPAKCCRRPLDPQKDPPGVQGVAQRAHDMFLPDLPGHLIARRGRVARTFQNIRLFAGMTVLENLLVAQHNRLMPNVATGLLAVFGLGPQRRVERDAIARARHWLDRIGLVARADEHLTLRQPEVAR